MTLEKEVAHRLRETLTQVSLELEASAQAALAAAQSLPDEHALWTNLQRMFARLQQATHVVSDLQRLADEYGAARHATEGSDEP